MNAVIVIPARYASTRFPGKPLADIAGKSLIQRVYERALGSARARSAYVATDDQRIADHVRSFEGRVVFTREDHESGTDRIEEALDAIEREQGWSCDQIINVQGDEPLIDIGSVDRVIEVLQGDPAIDVATLACSLRGDDEFRDRDVVKVVTDLSGNALYFSRAPIPHDGAALARRHVGVYGYQARVLRAFPKLAPSPLERQEKLEQLRLLQNGFRIRVLETDKPHLGVDRPSDVERVVDELRKLQ
ncbi:MAG: 3-deoxy-manno-octulosonate cytidylyltransferase [Acidobacteria bacterium]|nr:3-deoxy-manno-octulosonate cytidylyltransferase [Acidobacteriota bacterium]